MAIEAIVTSSWVRDNNMKLICKIVGNMDINLGTYDHDILITGYTELEN